MQPVGDGEVGAALGEQPEDLPFPVAQPVQPGIRARGGEQLPDHLRVQRGAAGRDPVQRLDEVAGTDDAVLQQVPDAGRVVVQELARVAGLDPLGEHEYRRFRMRPADRERGAQALVGVRRRHPDVDDRHVRPVLGHGGDEVVPVVHGGGHRDAVVGEQRRDDRAQHRVSSLRQGQRDRGRAAGRAVDVEVPVERVGPPCQAGQAGAVGTGRRAAVAVVGHGQP